MVHAVTSQVYSKIMSRKRREQERRYRVFWGDLLTLFRPTLESAMGRPCFCVARFEKNARKHKQMNMMFLDEA